VSAPRSAARRLLTQARAAGRRSEQSFGYGTGDDLSGETATARIDDRLGHPSATAAVSLLASRAGQARADRRVPSGTEGGRQPGIGFDNAGRGP